MFFPWNFDEWIPRVGAVLLMFGLVAALNGLIDYVTSAVWGEESESEASEAEASGKTGFSKSKAKTDPEPGIRKAA